jgi:hypothetical protein
MSAKSARCDFGNPRWTIGSRQVADLNGKRVQYQVFLTEGHW